MRESAGLRDALLDLFARPFDPKRPRESLAERDFGGLALRIFREQCRTIPALAALAEARGIDPDGVDDWRRIPPVPTRAFKALDLVAGPVGAADRSFRTSGTTRGPGSRGVHHVPDLELYRASVLATFRAFVSPDGAEATLLTLIPPAAEVSDSSLSAMMAIVREGLSGGADGPAQGGDFVDSGGAIDRAGLDRAIRAAVEADRPVVFAGTAFAFVHWMDGLGAGGAPTAYRLPGGSRIVETGGFKGRSRELSRAELHEGLAARTGVPRGRIVNEYGMTELLSQYYDPVLVEGAAHATGLHRGPPWLRPRVLDPETLEELPAGEVGLLCHTDLANRGSAVSVLTEDRGRMVDGDLELLGRLPGAEPRGCSLAMDALMTAAGQDSAGPGTTR